MLDFPLLSRAVRSGVWVPVPGAAIRILSAFALLLYLLAGCRGTDRVDSGGRPAVLVDTSGSSLAAAPAEESAKSKAPVKGDVHIQDPPRPPTAKKSASRSSNSTRTPKDPAPAVSEHKKRASVPTAASDEKQAKLEAILNRIVKGDRPSFSLPEFQPDEPDTVYRENSVIETSGGIEGSRRGEKLVFSGTLLRGDGDFNGSVVYGKGTYRVSSKEELRKRKPVTGSFKVGLAEPEGDLILSTDLPKDRICFEQQPTGEVILVLPTAERSTYCLDGRIVNLIPGVTFDAEVGDPLYFAFVKKHGFTYLMGRGSVTRPDGTKIVLPLPSRSPRSTKSGGNVVKPTNAVPKPAGRPVRPSAAEEDLPRLAKPSQDEKIRLPFEANMNLNVRIPPVVAAPPKGAKDGDLWTGGENWVFEEPVHPEGEINSIFIEGRQVALASNALKDGMAITKDFGEVEILALGPGRFEPRATLSQIERMRKWIAETPRTGGSASPSGAAAMERKEESRVEPRAPAPLFMTTRFSLASMEQVQKEIEVTPEQKDRIAALSRQYREKVRSTFGKKESEKEKTEAAARRTAASVEAEEKTSEMGRDVV